LPALLKPGGRIAIWVYSTLMLAWCRPSDAYRHLTTRLPKKTLYALCHVAIPWYHLNRVPVLGRVTSRALPTSGHPNPEWRVLDTFDWYSPKYQWKHSDAELQAWFEAHGLVSLTSLSFPTSMQGMRPAASPVSSRAAVEVPAGELPR
jgi:hypothetical protein